jgi:PAS domain S-box-containing protein
MKRIDELDTLIINTVGSMVIVTDRTGRIIRFNEGGSRILGYSVDEVLGKIIWDFLPPPEYRQRTKERFLKLLEGGSLDVDAVWVGKSGERKYLTCSCMGARGESGQVEYTVGTGIDATARVLAEQALRESEERFRTTFNDAAIGMALVDESARYVQVNRTFCQMLGYSEEELLKTDFASLTHPDDRGKNLDLLHKLFGGEIPAYVLEKRYITRANAVIWVQVSASLATRGEGRAARVIGMFENISERKAARDKLEEAYAQMRLMNETLELRVAERTGESRARAEELSRSEKSLREQTHILRSILDSMGDGVLVADCQGNFVLVNPAAERISGPMVPGRKTLDERLNQPIFFRPDGQTRYGPTELPMARSMRGEPVDDFEALIRREGQPEVWTSTTGRPLRDETGEIKGGVIVMHDVTDRKRHEAELLESEQHYRDLAESHLRLAREVEHRVRNNLQGLLGLLSVMRDRAQDVQSLADAMEARLGALRHVHELLAQTQWSPVGLRTLVGGALNTLKHMAPCMTIPVHVEGPDVYIAPRQVLPLTLVLVEWFTNSCKYGAHSVPTGQLHIQWRTIREGEAIWVSLTWTERGGPPTPEKIIPSLGTELVQGFVRRELKGRSQLKYPPQGVEHTIEFALAAD